jgi:hypothetical protein
MTDKQETVADIVAEMRRIYPPGPLCEKTVDGQFVHDEMHWLADRIEAAVEEERRILVADAENAKDARNRMGIKLRQEFADKCKECAAKVGNAAKLREALDKIGNILLYMKECSGNEQTARYATEALGIMHAALAAPPRNCDRFANWMEAWDVFLQKYPQAKKYGPWEGIWGGRFLHWLFAPAAQEGGEA